MSATTSDALHSAEATAHAGEESLQRPDAQRDGIGLCLSGGGYRATLFHLGALLRLNELGVLDRVKTISSVSGGSIMAAGLAAAIVKRAGALGGLSRAEWEKDVSGPVREVTKKNIRTWPVLNRLLPWNWLRSATGVETLAATYEKQLTPLRLAQLPIATAFLFLASLGYAQGTPTITVRILVNASYDDSAAAVAQVAALARRLPPTVTNVVPGDTLSKLITRIYRFGPSDLPKTYAALEKKILADNGLSSPLDLKPGDLFIPTLPKKATPRWTSSIRTNAVPKTYVLPTPVYATAIPSVAADDLYFDDAPKVIEARREGSRYAEVTMQLPESVVQELLSDPQVWARMKVDDQPLTLRLADTAANETQETHSVLTQVEKDRLRELLYGAPQRIVHLIILDTGWPTAQIQAESQVIFSDLLDRLRARITLDLGKPPHVRKEIPWSGPPSNPHSVEVLASLREFLDLDHNQRVRVAFLPLNRTQGVAPLLQELLYLHFLADSLESNLGNDPPLRADLALADSKARKIIARLPADSPDSEVHTDKALMDAMFTLLTSYGSNRPAAFFLSESWTVQNRVLKVSYPDFPQGAVVAAAGNERGRNIHSIPYVDFASRSLNHTDTIAVMNVDHATGDLQCESSAVDIDPGVYDDVDAVSFDGRVTSTLCGTSFAAPRVAWLLALGEASRRQSFSPDQWCTRLKNRLRSLRSGAPSFGAMWLDPLRFLHDIEK